MRFEAAALGYGNRTVLAKVDLSIPEQAFVGVLGPNGSGKSTLIRSLMGLLPCAKGRIVAAGSAGPLRFGYVPQKERLDPIYPLTAFEVAAMGTYRGWEFPGSRRRQRHAQVSACLQECGAGEFSGKRFGDLSGGQKQRVLIARALASQPDVLVLDEPLAGIDSFTQEALLGLLRTFRDGRRLTILMVSHRIQAEKDLFTHVIWTEDGRAVFGQAEEMLASERLQTAFRSGL